MHETDPRFLRGIIDTLNEGLVFVGPDGRIRIVNPALERLTGFTRDELVGRACSVLQCDACVRQRKDGGAHWCRLFDRKGENRKRCTVRRKDGTVVPVLKNARVLTDGQGGVQGAVEIITDLSELVDKERRIEELSRLLGSEEGFAGMVGASSAMHRTFRLLERAAESDAPVLLLGASGTGKELAARAVHELGRRRNGPYVQLNCAALNENLLESELFGHVRGAFTGAVRDRQGRFEAAHGGDLFLDEIGDLPLPTQVKLLRVLETKRIERVGDNHPREVDVRIIAATNRNLGALVRAGRFREDLLFRINVIPVTLPALAARREDIPLLAAFFLRAITERDGRKAGGLTPAALRHLVAYTWPGNVRELRSAMEYACVVAGGGDIDAEHLPPHIIDGTPECGGHALAATVAERAGPDAAQEAPADEVRPDAPVRVAGPGAGGGTQGRAGEVGAVAAIPVVSAVPVVPAVPVVTDSGPDHEMMSVDAHDRVMSLPGTSGEAGTPPPAMADTFPPTQRELREGEERRQLLAALRRARGNISEAARLLGVYRGTVRNRMARYGIDLHREVKG